MILSIPPNWKNKLICGFFPGQQPGQRVDGLLELSAGKHFVNLFCGVRFHAEQFHRIQFLPGGLAAVFGGKEVRVVV